MNKTPLHAHHLSLGAKMAEFAGFDMPIQYKGIVEEHWAVRRASGLFDVSHMGNFFVRGAGAAKFIDSLVTGDIMRLPAGKALYTLLCNPSGGAVDDLLVYHLTDGRFMLIVNAANIGKDFHWMDSRKVPGIELSDESRDISILALQGPSSAGIVDALSGGKFASMPPFTVSEIKLGGITVLLARTGYTGEDGCEIFVRNSDAALVWELLLSKGVQPTGLGARDTLRLEMGYTLYGHEVTEETNVLEAGLGWVVNFDKPEFLGKEALLRSKAVGLKRKLVGLIVTGKGIPRSGGKIFKGKEEIGTITSGGYSPVLEKGVALGYVGREGAKVGDSLEVEVRDRRLPVEVVNRKFIQK